MLTNKIILTAVALFFASCSADKTQKITSTESNHADKKNVHHSVNAAVKKIGQQFNNEQSNKTTIQKSHLVPTLKKLLHPPPVIRFATPGMVRFAIPLNEPVSFITWSPLAGFSVSVGRSVHNITSKGLDRWQINAGSGHRIFVIDGEEVIWSKEFERLFHVMRNGRTGWSIVWKHEPMFKSGSDVYLVDAANVAAINSRGKQKWLVSPQEVRTMEGPFVCNNNVLFQGRRGKQSMAYVITPGGSIFAKYEMPVASVLLGTSDNCLPVIWSGEEQNNEIFLLNTRGEIAWSHHLKTVPLFNKTRDAYLLAIPNDENPIRMVKLNFDGSVAWNSELPVIGRLTRMDIFDAGNGQQVVGLCKDVSSPCTRNGGNRGPFNTVVLGRNGKFSVLERVVSGHINITEIKNKGFVTAVSRTENETELTMRNSEGAILWTTLLPGRFSAGPYAGPYDAVYLGTCTGWKCKPPYHFISVTAVKKEKD